MPDIKKPERLRPIEAPQLTGTSLAHPPVEVTVDAAKAVEQLQNTLAAAKEIAEKATKA